MKQITEDYVSYEIAQLLKEKGFDEPTRFWYNDKGIISQKYIDPTNNPLGKSYHYAAPTQSFALKWLREVHNLYIEIRRNLNTFYYGWKVEQGMSEKAVFDYKYDSYEQAVEVALKFTLENLI